MVFSMAILLCRQAQMQIKFYHGVQDGPADDPAPSPEGASLDNLSDVEVDDAIEGKMLPDYILGQYELVKRIRNRWKCTLNHAVMHLNGQDVVVSKAAGEFMF